MLYLTLLYIMCTLHSNIHDTILYTILYHLHYMSIGMHLEGSTKEKSYLADALSANTNLYETHFTSLHKYRLEYVYMHVSVIYV